MNEAGASHIPETVRKMGEDLIPKEERKKTNSTMSQETAELLKRRRGALEQGRWSEAEELTKKMQTSKRRDRSKYVLETLTSQLDVRDRWLGIRQLRKGYKPIPYSLKDETGKHIPREQRAHHAANFLATKIWGKSEGTITTEWKQDLIIKEDLGMNVAPITMKEMKEARYIHIECVFNNKIIHASSYYLKTKIHKKHGKYIKNKPKKISTTEQQIIDLLKK